MDIARVGVYVDSTNISRNGGYKMRYNVLREFACRGGAEPIRLNAYIAYDVDRARMDVSYRKGQHSLHSWLRDFGFKVIPKKVKWYVDDDGSKYGKANADLDLAVDALTQSDNIDRVILGTGDGDFVKVVNALQNKGCRVEVVAFDHVSPELRDEADLFISGYLIPNLLPISIGSSSVLLKWGDIGSRVRGVCHSHQEEKGFGFFRYMTEISREIWKIDSREDASPYKSAFFHDSQLPQDVKAADLPSRNIIFEFDLNRPTRDGGELQANNIQLIGNHTRVIKK